MTGESKPLPNMAALAESMSAVLDRCVWSQTMTHESLITYLIEESYEFVDAVENGDAGVMLEELGDVLLQIVFHAEIASRTLGEQFTLDDVARSANEKMVRRHPHVFGDEVALTIDDVLRVWGEAKAREKKSRTSAIDGIPPQLPALVLADKVIGRAMRAGVLPDAEESRSTPVSTAEVPATAAGSATEVPATEAELGESLLATVRSARRNGLDAERALRGAVRALQDEIRRSESEQR